MTKPPFIFRLMLGTLFLPIILALCVFFYAILIYPPGDLPVNRYALFGVIPDIFVIVTLGSLPFLLWLWMILTGNWRKPVITAALVYFTFFIAATFEFIEFEIIPVPPEERVIHLLGIEGTDVYCNGVLLGQVPMKITVEELKAKVPEWNTPPEQRWYDHFDPSDTQTLYTWVPWDDFIKERFEASRQLFQDSNERVTSSVPRAVRARHELLNNHTAGCRYWWSYRLGDVQMVFSRDGSGARYRRIDSDSFDKTTSYYSSALGGGHRSPSAGFHAQLLIDVLPELTPEQKADWDKHVLKNWELLWQPLTVGLSRTVRKYEQDNEPLSNLYKAALHSTARLKYNISDPPTEEEARRLLGEWVRESMVGDDTVFFFGSYSVSSFSGGEPAVHASILIPADLDEVMRRPLIEQWRKNLFRFDQGWAPVAYFSMLGKSPDYFDSFARYTATTGNAELVLLQNESPLVTPLFNTLLHRRSMSDVLSWQINLYPGQINTFSYVNNPLVESSMRKYIETALADPKHNDSTLQTVNRAATSAVLARIDWEHIDKDELAEWTASLPITASSKGLALRMLRLKRDGGETFADRLQQAVGIRALIETELTLDDITKWFAENPKGTLFQFLGEQGDNISISGVLGDLRQSQFSTYMHSSLPASEMLEIIEHINRYDVSGQYSMWNELPKLFVIALLRSDTPEGDPQVRDLIRQIWKSSPPTVIEAIESENMMAVNLVGIVRGNAAGETISLPDYLFELFADEDFAVNSGLAQILGLCDSPKAGEILERWSGESLPWEYRRQVVWALEVWRTRVALRQRRVEVFEEIVAGRMSPDELLIPQPAWVWSEEGYVQER